MEARCVPPNRKTKRSNRSQTKMPKKAGAISPGFFHARGKSEIVLKSRADIVVVNRTLRVLSPFLEL